MSENTYNHEIAERIHSLEDWVSELEKKRESGEITAEEYRKRIARSFLARERLTERAEMKAKVDKLTQLPNRRWFDFEIDKEIARSRRTGDKLGLIFMDIDHFKGINDKYGHPVGDVALQKVARLANGVLRSEDFLARTGGEEFAVIAIKPEDLMKAAERFRTVINEARIPGIDKPISVSVGGSFFNPNEEKGQWLKRVDEALYAAKGAGRNNTKIM